MEVLAMSIATEFKPTVAEAAFIANISDRDANRLVDEAILPAELFETSDGRRLQLLGCVLGAFYFRQEKTLTKQAREEVIRSFVSQVKKGERYRAFLTLSTSIRKRDWSVSLGDVSVELFDYAIVAQKRYATIISTEKLIVSDPDVFDGEPVFKGTRVPVRTIAAWIDEGIPMEKIQEAYPAVTEKMVSLAPIYEKTHPRRGRPRKFGKINPDWKVKDVEHVKLSA